MENLLYSTIFNLALFLIGSALICIFSQKAIPDDALRYFVLGLVMVFVTTIMFILNKLERIRLILEKQ